MGWSASDSFWLSDTVSKHLTFPAVDTTQGSTFSPPTLDSTSSLDTLAPRGAAPALAACRPHGPHHADVTM